MPSLATLIICRKHRTSCICMVPAVLMSSHFECCIIHLADGRRQRARYVSLSLSCVFIEGDNGE